MPLLLFQKDEEIFTGEGHNNGSIFTLPLCVRLSLRCHCCGYCLWGERKDHWPRCVNIPRSCLHPPPPSSTTTPPQASCASVKAPSRVVRSIHPPPIYLLSSQAVAAMEKPAFTVKRPCDNRRRATFRTASLSTSPADHTMGQLLDMSHGLKAPLPDNFAYFPKRFCHTANRQM